MIFQMSEDELEAFVKLVDDNGEISKNDIIIQVKNIFVAQASRQYYSKQSGKRVKSFSIWYKEECDCAQTKQSSFWKGNLDLKNVPGSHSTKVKDKKYPLNFSLYSRFAGRKLQ